MTNTERRIEELKREIEKLRRILRDSGVNRSTLHNVKFNAQEQARRYNMSLELSDKEDELEELENLREGEMKNINKTNYQPSVSRAKGRDFLGRRERRLQYRMKYKEVNPIVDERMFKQIQSAWEKVKSPLGYSTYRDVSEKLRIPVGQLMQYLKGMHQQNPYSVRFQVNRMGDNVYFKFPTARERKEGGELINEIKDSL